MRFFQIRLVVAMLLGMTLFSAVTTYFDVLAHTHALRQDLQQRTEWFAQGIRPQLERALDSKEVFDGMQMLPSLRSSAEQPSLLLYDRTGQVIATAGETPAQRMLPVRLLNSALDKGIVSRTFITVPDNNNLSQQWYEEVMPLMVDSQTSAALVLLVNAESIHAEGIDIWKRSFLRILAMMALIVVVTLSMVSWLFQRPIHRAAEWLRKLRYGEANIEDGAKEFRYLEPLAREVTSLAEHLHKARESAENEAHLRNQGERTWTAERLAAHVRDQLGDGKLFVVSNREPYTHMRDGRQSRCITPSSGVVTAIEPILLACDGVWVAHGSGDHDFQSADEHGRLRVPPEDERYTLRRVALSAEEQAGYYEGFANEGLWPLCHIAHTRPIFRSNDWMHYKAVNQHFAEAVLEEMKDTEHPVVLVQDYHFALLPRMIQQARPDARIAIFWHIPWPNAEAFGICPWQAELLDGLLGADLIGFHLQSHCNNFMNTVDRVLEARTNWHEFTIRRSGHLSAIRPYPISVAWNQTGAQVGQRSTEISPDVARITNAFISGVMSSETRTEGKRLLLGVDRMDYTKGIPERLLAIDLLLTEHPWYEEQINFVQIAVPSRSNIPAYARLQTEVEGMVDLINQRHQTAHWKPVHLIQRQCRHEELAELYRCADVCLVTSLHDGMNLVAKEYLEARDDSDGVLVLSCFAGAALELKDALIVNPYDTVQLSGAIHAALEMPTHERHLRMERMRSHVKEHNVYRWASEILTDLCAVRISEDSIQVLHPSVRGEQVF